MAELIKPQGSTFRSAISSLDNPNEPFGGDLPYHPDDPVDQEPDQPKPQTQLSAGAVVAIAGALTVALMGAGAGAYGAYTPSSNTSGWEEGGGFHNPLNEVPLDTIYASEEEGLRYRGRRV